MPTTIDPSQAASIYAKNSNIGSASPMESSGKDDGVSFSDFLKETARDQIQTVKAGEQMSAKALTGDADITDVVMAVNAAELTLQTVVSIRDRVVQAYQEIMRMPI